jgi:uncharacterized protein (UPF0333 family)
MKTTVRNKKFTMGILLFLVIILVLLILSVFYLKRLSNKTGAILMENHISVVYARNMSKNLTNINQEIVNCLLSNKSPGLLVMGKDFKLFEESLELEKNNITEVGEDSLVSEIDKCFLNYRDSISSFIQLGKVAANYTYLLSQFDNLYKKLMQLSLLNETAIELKTNDAKISTKDAMLQMSIIGAVCFLVAYAFTFSFSSYYNDRFFKLYEEIKDCASSNYSQKLTINGSDELGEISYIINDMAEKLNKVNPS